MPDKSNKKAATQDKAATKNKGRITDIYSKWESRSQLIGMTFLALSVAILVSSYFNQNNQARLQELSAFSFIAGLNLYMIWGIFRTHNRERERERQIRKVEENARESPEKPQLAWDLARTKLESYLARNLDQVRSIFWLTVFVMGSGFAFIVYGLNRSFDAPQQLAVGIVSAASGILVSFIGGSFLLIYRSILNQSKEYVTVLERINAVGMAVQVIASIPDSGIELKNKATVDLAKQLLSLYAPHLARQINEKGREE